MAIPMLLNLNQGVEKKINTMPKTSLGKWSVRLIIIFLSLLLIFRLLVVAGQRGGATFFSNLWLTIPALLMVITGASAFFTGIISIIKNKERAILVYLTTAIGLLILIFCLGEILFPH